MDTPIWDSVVRDQAKLGRKVDALSSAIAASLKENDPNVWVRPLAIEVLKWLKDNGWALRRR